MFIKIKCVACSPHLQKVGVFLFFIVRFSVISSTAKVLQLRPTNHRTVNKQMQLNFKSDNYWSKYSSCMRLINYCHIDTCKNKPIDKVLLQKNLVKLSPNLDMKFHI